MAMVVVNGPTNFKIEFNVVFMYSSVKYLNSPFRHELRYMYKYSPLNNMVRLILYAVRKKTI